MRVHRYPRRVRLWLAIGVGGALGALARWSICELVLAVADSPTFPWGLLVVNVIGSFVIGIAYVSFEGPMRALLATGACGALTTYSSYALFVNRVWSEKRSSAWAAIIVMPIACIGACGSAVAVTRAVIGA